MNTLHPGLKYDNRQRQVHRFEIQFDTALLSFDGTGEGNGYFQSISVTYDSVLSLLSNSICRVLVTPIHPRGTACPSSMSSSRILVLS